MVLLKRAFNSKRKNMNSFINFLNGFYSQNLSQDSSYSELCERKLENINLKASNVIEGIESGNLSVLILTGNAGDGKTFLCQQIYETLTGEIFENKPEFKTMYGQKELIIIKDASELNSEELCHHSEEIEKILLHKKEQNKIYILAGNEGRLSDIFNTNRTKTLYEAFEKALDRETFNESTKALSELEIINFSFRSLTEKSAFDSIINSFLGENDWEDSGCSDCKQNKECSIYCNVILLRENIVQKNIRKIFQLFFLTHGHFTLRELLSALSFTVTGNKTCDSIKSAHQKSNLFYNNIFSKQDQMFIQEDRLLKAISKFDVAFTPLPKINKLLNSIEIENVRGEDLKFLKSYKEKDFLLLSSLKRRVFFLNSVEFWDEDDFNIIKSKRSSDFLPIDSYNDFLNILDNNSNDCDVITIGLNLLVDKNSGTEESDIIIYHPFQKYEVKLSLKDKFLDTIIDKSNTLESKYIETEPNSFVYNVNDNDDNMGKLEITFSIFQMLFHTFNGNQSIVEYQRHARRIEEFRETLYYRIEKKKMAEKRLEYQIDDAIFIFKNDQ
ncbi:MAG: hypothetical protein GY710_24170 [Desulfobacteraceae bacterium]|nr:hypothetical protein [Desulfobacteraceae bacterium]